ncbi:MAG: ThuA domain-containing protein [Pseudoxanthomonas sp.]
MNRSPLRTLCSGLLLALCTLASFQAVAAPPRVLVFTKTAGWRHDSIPTAIAALQRLGAQEGMKVDQTEDPAAFSDGNLKRYRVVVFASTTGDVLDAAQQAAMENYIRAGGGYVGVHSAADTEYDWPWYGQLVGAWFKGHPPGLQTTKVVFERNGIPDGPAWTVTDEIYNYRSNPRNAVRVTATVDERDYTGGTMGADHPIAWCHSYDGGRAWYTGLGHDAKLYADPRFEAQLRRGLRYAARLSEDC